MSNFISLLLSSLVQLILFSLIPFIWWLFAPRKEKFFVWIGLKQPVLDDSRLKVFTVIVVALAFYIGAMYLIMTTLLNETPTAISQFSDKGLSALPSIFIYAVIETSLSEELFFRGFLCKRLTLRFDFITGNVIQSMLFGLVHGIPFGLATDNWLVFILLTLVTAFIGYIQGWLNERKANGSIIPSWIMHGLMNILAALSSI